MKLAILAIAASLSAGASFASLPELNSMSAADVQVSAPKADAAEADIPAEKAEAPDTKAAAYPKFRIIDRGNGQRVTLDNWAARVWVTDTEAAGIGDVYSWPQAEKLCADLDYAGFTDWELPTDKELAGLIDTRFKYPAIDGEFFPNTASSYYWTRTDHPENSFFQRVYTVGFQSGGVYYATKIGNRYHVRCVRPGNLSPQIGWQGGAK